MPPTSPAPRTIPTAAVARMRERCRLDQDFRGVGRKLNPTADMGARRTGRTTLMLLHALVAYEEGRDVVLVGERDNLVYAWGELMAASSMPRRKSIDAVRIIDFTSETRPGTLAYSRLQDACEVPRSAAVFIDHYAAHQMTEHALGGAVVMESPY